jgi:hypothetical protein
VNTSGISEELWLAGVDFVGGKFAVRQRPGGALIFGWQFPVAVRGR